MQLQIVLFGRPWNPTVVAGNQMKPKWLLGGDASSCRPVSHHHLSRRMWRNTFYSWQCHQQQFGLEFFLEFGVHSAKCVFPQLVFPPVFQNFVSGSGFCNPHILLSKIRSIWLILSQYFRKLLDSIILIQIPHKIKIT